MSKAGRKVRLDRVLIGHGHPWRIRWHGQHSRTLAVENSPDHSAGRIGPVLSPYSASHVVARLKGSGR